MLTLKMLKDMPPHTVFAEGTTEYEYWTGQPVEIDWIAVRGGIWDWAIYYLESGADADYIRTNGDKLTSEGKIKELVPCDDEAFENYRF